MLNLHLLCVVFTKRKKLLDCWLYSCAPYFQTYFTNIHSWFLWSILLIKSKIWSVYWFSKMNTPFLIGSYNDRVVMYSETTFSNKKVNNFGPSKNSSEVIEKLRLRNFQGSQVSSFDFSTLYTSLPHDLIKAKVMSLVKWWFNRESKTYLCSSDKARFSSNKKYDSYTCWTCTEFYGVFTFLVESYMCNLMSWYTKIFGITIGTNCVPLLIDLFLYCYERDFMSNLQK